MMIGASNYIIMVAIVTVKSIINYAYYSTTVMAWGNQLILTFCLTTTTIIIKLIFLCHSDKGGLKIKSGPLSS